jgi:chromosome segregation ATPase
MRWARSFGALLLLLVSAPSALSSQEPPMLTVTLSAEEYLAIEGALIDSREALAIASEKLGISKMALTGSEARLLELRQILEAQKARLVKLAGESLKLKAESLKLKSNLSEAMTDWQALSKSLTELEAELKATRAWMIGGIIAALVLGFTAGAIIF